MKINTQRAGKYIASFLGIALALVLCVIPAFASQDGIYIPADYVSGKPVVDAHGVITYHYSFNVTPLIRISFTDTLHSQHLAYEVDITVPEGVQKTTFRVFPLGVYVESNKPWATNRGVIDVRDFKAYSQFDLAATFDVGITWPSPDTGTITYRHYWYVQCYDDAGYPTGVIRSTTVEENFDPVGAGGKTITCGGTLQLPENTSYILPSAYLVLYGPPASGSHRYIIRTDDLFMSFSIDSVLENTQTMDAIEKQLNAIGGQLDDLQSSIDNIYEGSEDDKQAAEDSASNVGSQVNDYYSIMRELEQYEHIDQEWSATILANFLNSDGYLKVKDLMSPLLNWGPYNTIMLTILALVNLSVILFGR